MSEGALVNCWYSRFYSRYILYIHHICRWQLQRVPNQNERDIKSAAESVLPDSGTVTRLVYLQWIHRLCRHLRECAYLNSVHLLQEFKKETQHLCSWSGFGGRSCWRRVRPVLDSYPGIHLVGNHALDEVMALQVISNSRCVFWSFLHPPPAFDNLREVIRHSLASKASGLLKTNLHCFIGCGMVHRHGNVKFLSVTLYEPDDENPLLCAAFVLPGPAIFYMRRLHCYLGHCEIQRSWYKERVEAGLDGFPCGCVICIGVDAVYDNQCYRLRLPNVFNQPKRRVLHETFAL